MGRPLGLNDPEWPKSAVSFGGKLGDDDTDPNTLTAGFNYGDRELVLKRGNLTGGRNQARVVTAGQEQDAPDGQAGAAPQAPCCPRPTSVTPAIRSTWESAIFLR
jgi:hypothetical protein